jgi:hypothetical protein
MVASERYVPGSPTCFLLPAISCPEWHCRCKICCQFVADPRDGTVCPIHTCDAVAASHLPTEDGFSTLGPQGGSDALTAANPAAESFPGTATGLPCGTDTMESTGVIQAPVHACWNTDSLPPAGPSHDIDSPGAAATYAPTEGLPSSELPRRKAKKRRANTQSQYTTPTTQSPLKAAMAATARPGVHQLYVKMLSKISPNYVAEY